jgi:hypothetical protein
MNIMDTIHLDAFRGLRDRTRLSEMDGKSEWLIRRLMIASVPTYLSPRMRTVIVVAAHHFDAIVCVVRSDLGEAGSEALKPDPAFRVPAPMRSSQPPYPTLAVKGDGHAPAAAQTRPQRRCSQNEGDTDLDLVQRSPTLSAQPHDRRRPSQTAARPGHAARH